MQDASNFVRYSIDAADDIVAIGDGWNDFAIKNGSPELIEGNILHRSFWDFVSGEALQHVYRRIMERVRAGDIQTFSFRCDSPELRRYLSLRMELTSGGGIEFTTETICTETREFQKIFDAKTKRNDALVVVCSWCIRIRTPSQIWQEAEEAVRTLSLFEIDCLPAVSHGICDECYQFVIGKTSAAKSLGHRHSLTAHGRFV